MTQDITHLKALAQEQRLIIASIVHDFRTPLAYVKGYAELLPDLGELNEDGQQAIEKISSTADRMAEILDYYLYLQTPVDAAEVARRQKLCDIRGLLNEVTAALQNKADHSAVPMTLSAADDDYLVAGCASALHNMVWLLVYDAIHETAAQDADASGSREVRFALSRDETEIRLCAAYQGQALPPDERPYFQQLAAEMPYYRRLGIEVVKAIADAHGGWVEIERLPGGDVEIEIVLPAAETPGSEG